MICITVLSIKNGMGMPKLLPGDINTEVGGQPSLGLTAPRYTFTRYP